MGLYAEKGRTALVVLVAISLIISTRDCYRVVAHHFNETAALVSVSISLLCIAGLLYGNYRDNMICLVAFGVLMVAAELTGYLSGAADSLLYSIWFNLASGFAALLQTVALLKNL